MRYRLRSILLLFFCLASLPSQSQELSFEDRVRGYILANPEVIIEAMEILAERERRAEITERIAAFPELFVDAARLGEGDAAAPQRVIEFFDYKCAPCKAMHPALVEFTDSHPEVRVEMRHLPILTPGSERAARFALATRETYGDKAHKAVHRELWDIQGPLNAAGFQRVATELSLDFQKIAPAMESEAVSARIDYNRNVAIALGVLGTPAFLTPDSMVFGTTDIDALGKLWLNR
ncbi:MAG: DsbA family protein [Pseudomonadota bacterium]